MPKKVNEEVTTEVNVETNQEAVETVEAVETAAETKEPEKEVNPKDFEGEILENDKFFRRTITLTSKRKSKQIFRDEAQIIGDEYDSVESEGKRRKMEYDILSDSAKAQRPKICRGRVFAVEPVEFAGHKTYYVLVNFLPDPTIKRKDEVASLYTIKIPAPMFFIYEDPERYEGEEGRENLYKELSSRIGSLCDFVVYDIQADVDDVIASRVIAMQIKSYDYYLGRNKKVEVGSTCVGNVTRIGRHGLTCEILGAECYIPNAELDWNHITAASEMFETGDKINVIVKSIEPAKVEIYGRTYSYLKVTASRKEAIKNPADKYFDTFEKGQKVSGIITQRLDTGEYFVTLAGRITCKCKPPQFGRAEVGQECIVTIKSKNREDKTITGAFSYLGR